MEDLTVEKFLNAVAAKDVGHSACMIMDLAINYYLGIALYDAGIKVNANQLQYPMINNE